MSEFLGKWLPAGQVDEVMSAIPRIGKAAAILIIGWIAAMIIAAIVKAIVKKTGLGTQLSKVLPGGNPVKLIGKVVFYLVMLFVAVATLQALDLTMVTEPLNAFLNKIMEYLPRLIGAGVLGGIAWVLATVLKKGSHKGLEAMDLDNRLMSMSGEAKTVEIDEDGYEIETAAPELGLAKTVSETLYWLVFLVFLPGILGALQMPGLLEPVQGMMSKLMDFLPNLVGAVIIGGVGWLVASIVQKVVTNLLAAAGADRMSEKFGLASALGTQKLSGLLGTVVHALVLLPVIVAALNALQIDAVTEPASAMLNKMTGALPNIFAGGLVLGIAFFVGKIVSGLATNVLSGVGFDKVPAKLGFKQNLAGASAPSTMVGKLIMAAILFFASMQAMNFFGLKMVADQMDSFVGFAFQILVGLVVVGFGFYLANLAASAIQSSGAPNANALAKVARLAIVVLSGAMGLQRMGLADSIVNLTFGLTLGSIAVASAIAFGWGGRDAAKRLCDKYIS